MTQCLNPGCCALLHWCRCIVCILSLSAWHLLFLFLDAGGGRKSARISERRAKDDGWYCLSLFTLSGCSALYLLPKASPVTWIRPNHPPVTFDTHHMMRLKPLLVALRLKFLSAIQTASQGATHPSKAYVGVMKVRVLLTRTFNGAYTQRCCCSSGSRMTQIRYFPWAGTTEGITQKMSQESRTYSRTRCFCLQTHSQSLRAIVGLNVMIRVRMKAKFGATAESPNLLKLLQTRQEGLKYVRLNCQSRPGEKDLF